MTYRSCGPWGLRLPALTFGLWHNFGAGDDLAEGRAMLQRCWEAGITHFDLADNYGPPPGSAEENFGRILREDFAGQRDQMIISSKAGHLMWDGPYGDGASRKHLLAGIDQSLTRLGLDYVDLFYTHRPDPDTPLEETAGALSQIVRQGKALYIGISKYPEPLATELVGLLREEKVPVVIHQCTYSLLDRWPEDHGLDEAALERLGLGLICFSPLAQGMLTDKYLDTVPAGSRAERSEGFLQTEQVEAQRERIRAAAAVARERGEPLARTALAWVLQRPGVTSALFGARTMAQLEENLAALEAPAFRDEELATLEAI